MRFIDGVDVGCLVGIGFDFILAYGLHRLYKRALRSAINIENVQKYSIDRELSKKLEDVPYSVIPYGCIEGVIYPAGATLKSNFNSEKEGVMQHTSLVEHKSRRVQGIWSDVKNVIRDTLEMIPFYLVPHGEGLHTTKVLVTEPNSAHHIDEELSVTHENFIQTPSDIIKKGMELISGEVHKGYQETEKMLLVGRHLMAIGKIVKEGEEIKMMPPSSDFRYILSQKTKDELVRLHRNKATIYKVLVGVLGVAGATLICVLVYRYYKKIKNYKDEQRRKEEFQRLRDREEQRRARIAHRTNPETLLSNTNSNTSDNWDQLKCVVCLTNEREVVLLNCGHVCVCGDCAFALPEPKKCPVCRERVERFVTTFTP